MLVHDVDGLINWHLKEQLYVCEQEGRNLIPPLGKEGDAAASCKTCLNRRKVWNASKIEIAKEKQELPPYSFRHRYDYYDYNLPIEDGSYRAPI